MAVLSFVHLNDVGEFKPPFEKDYALLLLIKGRSIDSNFRKQLSDKIVASRCRYFLCSGPECTLWDDEIDFSAVEQKKTLMTTWHDDEQLEETLYFLEHHVWDSENDKAIDFKCIMSLGGDGAILERCKEIIKKMKD